MRFLNRNRLLIIACSGILGWALLVPAHAAQTIKTIKTIKCWTNRDGVRECGDIVPPEYAQQGYERRAASGVTVGTQMRAKSLEELEEERRLVAVETAKQHTQEQQHAKDLILLQTFASVDDLQLARDGQIQSIEAQIRVTQNHIGKLQANLDAMIASAADEERRGETPSTGTVTNIENVRKQIAENESFIAAQLAEKESVTARYGADIARYRELKNLPAAQNSPAPTAATVPPNTSSDSP